MNGRPGPSAIPAARAAALSGLTVGAVMAEIHAGRILGTRFAAGWYVSDAVLADLRALAEERQRERGTVKLRITKGGVAPDSTFPQQEVAMTATEFAASQRRQEIVSTMAPEYRAYMGTLKTEKQKAQATDIYVSLVEAGIQRERAATLAIPKNAFEADQKAKAIVDSLRGVDVETGGAVGGTSAAAMDMPADPALDKQAKAIVASLPQM